MTSAGNQVSLMRCFRNAAQAAQVNLHVVAVDQEPQNRAACLLANSCHAVPPVRDSHYVPSLLEIAGKRSVDIVLPCSVIELDKLSGTHALFAKLGVQLVLPEQQLTRELLDVVRMEHLVRDAGAEAPRIAKLPVSRAGLKALTWPVVVRPRSYRDFPYEKVVLRSPDELSRIQYGTQAVLQERPQGLRYILQLYFDANSQLRFLACARVSLDEYRCPLAVTELHPGLTDFGEKLSAILKRPTGPIRVEAVVAEGDRIVIEEIVPNLSELYPVMDRGGAPICRWLLEKALNRNLGQGPTETVLSGIKMLMYQAPLFLSESRNLNLSKIAH